MRYDLRPNKSIQSLKIPKHGNTANGTAMVHERAVHKSDNRSLYVTELVSTHD